MLQTILSSNARKCVSMGKRDEKTDDGVLAGEGGGLGRNRLQH